MTCATLAFVALPGATAPPVNASPSVPPSAAPADIVISNSGSTNTAGFTIVIHPDFSADVTMGGSVRHAEVGAAQAKWLRAKLAAAMPLAALVARPCMKSASFGTRTRLTYEGETTPDVSCPGDAAVTELARTVAVIETRLDVRTVLRRRALGTQL